jgi:hypothetical protein
VIVDIIVGYTTSTDPLVVVLTVASNVTNTGVDEVVLVVVMVCGIGGKQSRSIPREGW